MMYKEDKTMREDYKAAKKLADDAVKEAKKKWKFSLSART